MHAFGGHETFAPAVSWASSREQQSANLRITASIVLDYIGTVTKDVKIGKEKKGLAGLCEY
jgi:urease alpha subunit